jgi:hypothetical protein
MRQGQDASRRFRGRGVLGAVLPVLALILLIGLVAKVRQAQVGSSQLAPGDRALTFVGNLAYAIPLLRTHVTLGSELFGPDPNYNVISKLLWLSRMLAAYRGSCGTYPSRVDAPRPMVGAPAACTADLGEAVVAAWQLAQRSAYSFELRYEPADPIPGTVPAAWGDYAIWATWAGEESHARLRLQGTRSFRMEAAGVRWRWTGLGEAEPGDTLHHPFPAPDPLSEARAWAEQETWHRAHPR